MTAWLVLFAIITLSLAPALYLAFPSKKKGSP